MSNLHQKSKSVVKITELIPYLHSIIIGLGAPRPHACPLHPAVVTSYPILYRIMWAKLHFVLDSPKEMLHQ